MIVTIVDSIGTQIYRGHESNKKVARLIEQGNVRVDSIPPDQFAIWDGAAWQPSLLPVIAPENTQTILADIEQLLRAEVTDYDGKLVAIKRARVVVPL